MTIIHVGCGLGFTAHELNRFFPAAQLLGIDVSNDAVEYGKNKFGNCEFISEAIDPDDESKKTF